MTNRLLRASLVAVLMLVINSSSFAVPEKGSPISISVRGKNLSFKDTASPNAVQMNLGYVFELGNDIEVTGAKCLFVQLDERLPECMVYSQNESVKFVVPDGTAQQVYPKEAFAGEKHVIKARKATEAELAAYRNVALNPYDVKGETSVYPHATSNSECRDEPCFSARNAIDGYTSNTGHGPWPYQSWGPDQRTDLWWTVEFGRSVIVDKIVLWIRADFPHDKNWDKATIEFSDGSRESINIKQTNESQTFEFRKRQITWLTLTDLVQTELLGWCGLTEVEVWGKDVAPPSKPKAK